MQYIWEPLIVGQDRALEGLQNFLQYAKGQKISSVGVAGMGGSGKTLLLKRFFNSDQVQNFYSNDLLLWLTVSQSPSLKNLRNDLAKQIASRINETLESTEEEYVKMWLHSRMLENKFALFLDDIWEESSYLFLLMEELCVPLEPPHLSNIIVLSSRNYRVFLQLGVRPSDTIFMEKLDASDSWKLFTRHAFPHNNGNVPQEISLYTVTGVCAQCGGLPLAIKVIGRAMASITDPTEWQSTLKRMIKKEPKKCGHFNNLRVLYDRLRLSFDALEALPDDGVPLRLCFLYLAAFTKDQIIDSVDVIRLWIGEGLLAGDYPFQIGQNYINLLADRCLIEVTHRHIDGRIRYFRLYDVLHDLAGQIAENEERCFFAAGKFLKEFPARECLGCDRVSMMDNMFSSVPSTFKGPEIRSWLMARNRHLKEIPRKVIGNMLLLRSLDLSNTSLLSLPETLGNLKHLVCLILQDVPIRRLPHSITALKNLQILNLAGSAITQLPASINKLASLIDLDIGRCRDLESIPHGISKLTCLQHLLIFESPNAWRKTAGSKPLKISASVNDLCTLTQLRRMELGYNGETIEVGTLAGMKQMEYLCLHLSEMKNVPDDIAALSNLKILLLDCPQVVSIDSGICFLHHLSHLHLLGCNMLEELPGELIRMNLRQLHIIECPSIRNLPWEFGLRGAFPRLEVFSLVKLTSLKELPIVQEGAMPSLRTFTLVQCEALQMLPESYWSLQSLKEIKVYGCSMVLQKMDGRSRSVPDENQKLKRAMSSKVSATTKKAITMTTMSIKGSQELLEQYHQIGREFWRYPQFWSNEHFKFLTNIFHP